MTVQKVEVEKYTCDNCGKTDYDEIGDPPVGITIHWFEVTAGGSGGTIWACRETCAVRALRRRHDIEFAREEAARQ